MKYVDGEISRAGPVDSRTTAAVHETHPAHYGGERG